MSNESADKQTSNNVRVGDGTPGPGRPKGSANRSTQVVRDAIAKVLETNAENFSKWLAAVAEGEKEPKLKDGKPMMVDGQQQMKWLRKPDPGFAVQLAMGMAEYHIPKLARTELKHEGEMSFMQVTINRGPPKPPEPESQG